MRIDSRTSNIRGMLFDLDANKPIRKAIWFDIESGEFEAYRTDEDGNIVYPDFADGKPLTYTGKTRLHFYPRKDKMRVEDEQSGICRQSM